MTARTPASTTPRNGEPQWGGLPHVQINALRVKPVVGGYELWMTCASRGIAVLFVPTDGIFANGFDVAEFPLATPGAGTFR